MVNFKFRFEHFIILVLSLILLFQQCEGEKDCLTDSVKITERTIIKKDSFSNSEIKNRKAVTVSVLETPKLVEIVPAPEKLPKAQRDLLKTAYRYRDTIRLDQATITTDILSEGRILKLDLKTSIDHLERTIEKTKKSASTGGLFLSPGVSYAPNVGIEAIETNLTFIKNQFGISIGGYYNIRTNTPGIQIIFHKKIL